jgi:hypothetical protein
MSRPITATKHAATQGAPLVVSRIVWLVQTQEAIEKLNGYALIVTINLGRMVVRAAAVSGALMMILITMQRVKMPDMPIFLVTEKRFCCP